MKPFARKVGFVITVAGMAVSVSGCGQPDDSRAGGVGTAPEERYEIRGSEAEIVLDTVTGLEWQRCSLGQSWDGQTCTGEAALYTWEGAGQAADEVAEWRLPTIDELRTLVYCSSGQPAQFAPDADVGCLGEYQRPTIVTEAFPNTPGLPFWSGSQDAGSAWFVYFLNGGAGDRGLSWEFGVRLVRGGQ